MVGVLLFLLCLTEVIIPSYVHCYSYFYPNNSLTNIFVTVTPFPKCRMEPFVTCWQNNTFWIKCLEIWCWTICFYTMMLFNISLLHKYLHNLLLFNLIYFPANFFSTDNGGLDMCTSIPQCSFVVVTWRGNLREI